ncbi:MAG: type III pantothenate kinase [Ginsengibacter sp.]
MVLKTTLCLDFGNTRLKCGVFKSDSLAQTVTLSNDIYGDISNLIKTHKPSHTILSSVIEHDNNIETLLQASSIFHKLSYQSKLPFTSPVGKPETIGADRIALVSAAVHLYPNAHTLVIALGTCITYNFINKRNEFLGGGISPGLNMRLQSLKHYTAKLPLVKPEFNYPLIGYDTATNILSGVIGGMANEIDGFIADYAALYGNFNVLLTGGNTSDFAGLLKNKIFADPDLLFKGLYAISEYNDTKT